MVLARADSGPCRSCRPRRTPATRARQARAAAVRSHRLASWPAAAGAGCPELQIDLPDLFGLDSRISLALGAWSRGLSRGASRACPPLAMAETAIASCRASPAGNPGESDIIEPCCRETRACSGLLFPLGVRHRPARSPGRVDPGPWPPGRSAWRSRAGPPPWCAIPPGRKKMCQALDDGLFQWRYGPLADFLPAAVRAQVEIQ